jgi:heptosyltransferase-2
MTELPVINFDCIHFYGDRPCLPNKEQGVFCPDCRYYQKDTSIGSFPNIPHAEPMKNLRSDGRKKIIIVKLDAVGDVLRTTSILPSLKMKFPESSITWITRDRSYEVLKDNDMIDEVYFVSDELDHVFEQLYDIAVNLDSGADSCSVMAGIRSIHAYGYTLINKRPYPLNSFAGEWYLMGIDDNTKKRNQKTYHKIIHEICGLEYENSAPVLFIDTGKQERIKEIQEKFGLENSKGLILINLGGGNRWQYKKWTAEGYSSLVKILSRKMPEYKIGIIAGEEDTAFYKQIEAELSEYSAVSGTGNIVYFGFSNSMKDFICIVSLAAEVFTSDSLCFHIATALGKYTIAVVGPTSYTELDVFGCGRIFRSGKVDCLCCYLNICTKTITCMNTLDAEEISAALLMPGTRQ